MPNCLISRQKDTSNHSAKSCKMSLVKIDISVVIPAYSKAERLPQFIAN